MAWVVASSVISRVVRRGRAVSTGQASLLQDDGQGGEVERVRFLATYGDLASVEVNANMDGRRMVMILAPMPIVVRKDAEVRKAAIQAQLSAKEKGQPLPKEPKREELAPLDQSEFDEDEDDEDLEGDLGAEGDEN